MCLATTYLVLEAERRVDTVSASATSAEAHMGMAFGRCASGPRAGPGPPDSDKPCFSSVFSTRDSAGRSIRVPCSIAMRRLNI